MAQALTLSQFETIDGLYGQLIRMGDFMECDDPRGYIRVSNRLLDACLAAGMDFDAPDHEAWAAEAICRALSSASMVDAA